MSADWRKGSDRPCRSGLCRFQRVHSWRRDAKRRRQDFVRIDPESSWLVFVRRTCPQFTMPTGTKGFVVALILRSSPITRHPRAGLAAAAKKNKEKDHGSSGSAKTHRGEGG